MRTTFDTSLPMLLHGLRTSLSTDEIQNGLVLRDSSGRLAFFAREAIPEQRQAELEALLRASLGPYLRDDLPIADASMPGVEPLLSDPAIRQVEEGELQLRILDRRIVGADWVRGPSPELVDDEPRRIVFASLKGGVGRVYTWLPLHLADAFMHTSPRAFLTVWREAGRHTPAPKDRAVDHLGILEGVRKASEDRLHELKEDYWWITAALEPLRDELVPMPLEELKELWKQHGTANTIVRQSSAIKRLAPVQLVATDARDPEAALVLALQAIGVLEIRSNQKINVPDIFRIEARIKRKGGVKPPRRAGS